MGFIPKDRLISFFAVLFLLIGFSGIALAANYNSGQFNKTDVGIASPNWYVNMNATNVVVLEFTLPSTAGEQLNAITVRNYSTVGTPANNNHITGVRLRYKSTGNQIASLSWNVGGWWEATGLAVNIPSPVEVQIVVDVGTDLSGNITLRMGIPINGVVYAAGGGPTDVPVVNANYFTITTLTGLGAVTVKLFEDKTIIPADVANVGDVIRVSANLKNVSYIVGEEPIVTVDMSNYGLGAAVALLDDANSEGGYGDKVFSKDLTLVSGSLDIPAGDDQSRVWVTVTSNDGKNNRAGARTSAITNSTGTAIPLDIDVPTFTLRTISLETDNDGNGVPNIGDVIRIEATFVEDTDEIGNTIKANLLKIGGASDAVVSWNGTANRYRLDFTILATDPINGVNSTDGVQSIELTAIDNGGNERTRNTNAITMDSELPLPPTNLLAEPAQDGRIKFSWTASASPDVGYYKIYSNNGSGPVNYSSPAGQTNLTNWTSGEFAHGTTLVCVIRTVDVYGNEETNTNQVQGTSDAQPPQMVFTNPVISAKVGTNGINLTASTSAIDLNGVNFKYRVKDIDPNTPGNQPGTYTALGGTVNGQTGSVNWNVNPGDNVYEVICIGTDKAGNFEEDSVAYKRNYVTITWDTKSPTVVVTQVDGLPYNGQNTVSNDKSSVAINFTATDFNNVSKIKNVWVRDVATGSYLVLAKPVNFDGTTGSDVVYFDARNFGAGARTFNIWVSDELGNNIDGTTKTTITIKILDTIIPYGKISQIVNNYNGIVYEYPFNVTKIAFGGDPNVVPPPQATITVDVEKYITTPGQDDIGSLILKYTTNPSQDDNLWTEISAKTGVAGTKTYTYNWDISAIPVGTYYVHCAIIDGSNNKGLTENVKIEIDRTAPSASFNIPITTGSVVMVPGETIKRVGGNNVKLKINSTATDIYRVRYRYRLATDADVPTNYTYIGGYVYSGPNFEQTFDTTVLPNKKIYVLNARVEDWAGNFYPVNSTSAIKENVLIDNQVPELSWVSVAGDSSSTDITANPPVIVVKGGTVVRIAVKAQEKDVASTNIWVEDLTSPNTFNLNLGSATYNSNKDLYYVDWTTPATLYNDITFLIHVRFTDYIGNGKDADQLANGRVKVKYTVNPSAVMSSPLNGWKVMGDVPANKIKASALNAGVNTVLFQWKTPTGNVWTDIGTAVATPFEANASWDTRNLGDGTYQLRALAINKDGTRDSIPGTINVIVDNTNNRTTERATIDPYTKGVISSKGYRKVNDKIDLTATAGADVGVVYFFRKLITESYTQYLVNPAVDVVETYPYGTLLNTTTLADGIYDFLAIGEDKAGYDLYGPGQGHGNMDTQGLSTLTPVTLQIDNTGPTIVISQIGSVVNPSPGVNVNLPPSANTVVTVVQTDDGKDLARVVFSMTDPVSGNVIVLGTDSDPTGGFSIVWDTSKLILGKTYPFMIIGYDDIGNESPAVNYNFVIGAPKVFVSAIESEDGMVRAYTETATSVRFQYAVSGTSNWIDIGTVGVGGNEAFVTWNLLTLTDGTNYDVRAVGSTNPANTWAMGLVDTATASQRKITVQKTTDSQTGKPKLTFVQSSNIMLSVNFNDPNIWGLGDETIEVDIVVPTNREDDPIFYYSGDTSPGNDQIDPGMNLTFVRPTPTAIPNKYRVSISLWWGGANIANGGIAKFYATYHDKNGTVGIRTDEFVVKSVTIAGGGSANSEYLITAGAAANKPLISTSIPAGAITGAAGLTIMDAITPPPFVNQIGQITFQSLGMTAPILFTGAFNQGYYATTVIRYDDSPGTDIYNFLLSDPAGDGPSITNNDEYMLTIGRWNAGVWDFGGSPVATIFDVAVDPVNNEITFHNNTFSTFGILGIKSITANQSCAGTICMSEIVIADTIGGITATSAFPSFSCYITDPVSQVNPNSFDVRVDGIPVNPGWTQTAGTNASIRLNYTVGGVQFPTGLLAGQHTISITARNNVNNVVNRTLQFTVVGAKASDISPIIFTGRAKFENNVWLVDGMDVNEVNSNTGFGAQATIYDPWNNIGAPPVGGQSPLRVFVDGYEYNPTQVLNSVNPGAGFGQSYYNQYNDLLTYIFNPQTVDFTSLTAGRHTLRVSFYRNGQWAYRDTTFTVVGPNNVMVSDITYQGSMRIGTTVYTDASPTIRAVINDPFQQITFPFTLLNKIEVVLTDASGVSTKYGNLFNYTPVTGELTYEHRALVSAGVAEALRSGQYTLSFLVTLNGVAGTLPTTSTFVVDATPPLVRFTTGDSVVGKSPVIKLSITDAQSQVDTTKLFIDFWKVKKDTVYSIDFAGNTIFKVIENTELLYTATPATIFDGRMNTTPGNVTVKLPSNIQLKDGEVIQFVVYNGVAGWDIDNDGDGTRDYKSYNVGAVDMVGNSATPYIRRLLVDAAGPVITMLSSPSDLNFRASIIDVGSGVNASSIRLTENGQVKVGNFDASTGIFTYTATKPGALVLSASDNVGNTTVFTTSTEAGVLTAIATPHNYPNPFDPERGGTNIVFGISKTSNVTIKIFDFAGEPVATILDNVTISPNDPNYTRTFSDGTKAIAVPWYGETDGGVKVATGVYICYIKATDGSKTETATIKVAVRKKN